MNKIDPKEVAKRYNALDIIIDDDDEWHLRVKQAIKKFIHEQLNVIPDYASLKILNAGSAGYSYGLNENNITHVDVADKHISHLKNAIVADVANLPLKDGTFDGIICVGSVLNYCDPIDVMKEFARVLKPNGFIILEFECSKTFELLFKKGFNNSAVYIETFFDAHGDKERIWYFSEKYINRLAKSYGFTIKKRTSFHILSPLVYRMTQKETFAAKFSSLDKFCSVIPGLNKFGSNIICLLDR